MDKYMNANIAFSKFSRDYIELKKDLPIRPSEMGVLNIISKREGVFTPIMIAELLGVSKPMVAAHISALEEKGYIYKDFSPSDKRSFYVMPTEKAKKLVNESEVKLNEQLKTIENKLGDEKFALLVDLVSNAQKILENEK
ncbi:MAG: MarR family transcriptional regulator [Clostridia bacterium]|nr:MarR family transcriptional regulator [Clostridia bacterium]